ncbi:MAG: hypothetical protein IJS86_04585 [Lachnospiraceae bacterium]|nr:hypothetical protein [Lachnospiraceae bacterium]
MENETPVSVGDWILTIFLTCIPLVGIIMLFVWAFGGGNAKSKSNWAKAQLIWMLIGLVLSIVFYAILGASLLALVQSYS